MDYRLFFLDRAGRIARAQDVDAADDAAALAELHAVSAAYGVELWSRDRFVAKIDGAGLIRAEAKTP